MGDRAKFTNPITWVSLAPVLSSTWIQSRRGLVGGETGVARKAWLNPSARQASQLAHGTHSCWCGQSTAMVLEVWSPDSSPGGVSPGSSLETQSLRLHLRPVESNGST